MRLIFVRHGEPNYALDCLTEKGVLQAEKAAQRLRSESIDAMFSSPQGRALQTAQAASRAYENMPVETLDFMPNYVIGVGHFDLYLLAERGGEKFASSDQVYWLQNATVFKGTARYDGLPVIAEAFAGIGVNGTTPDASMNFAADTKNSVEYIILDKAAATVEATETVQLKAKLLPENVKGTITWATSDDTKATVDTHGVVTGVAAGSAVITATCNGAVAVCNVTVTAS